jgi:hypothetical protein
VVFDGVLVMILDVGDDATGDVDDDDVVIEGVLIIMLDGGGDVFGDVVFEGVWMLHGGGDVLMIW